MTPLGPRRARALARRLLAPRCICSPRRAALGAVPWAAFLLVVLQLLGPGRACAASVSGFVRSAADGEALRYVNVVVQEIRFGATTNPQGFYTITGIPAGTYTVVFSLIGMKTETRQVVVEQEQSVTLSLELATAPVSLPPMKVKGESVEPTIAPGKVVLQTRELRDVPSVAEADLFRAVQALPGVSSLSDFSSGLYVQGGSPDQNLILLDDVDVYNPSHLFGFFSTFNVDAVKTVDLQKSGYPARYGGRLSSLLDVHDRDGNRKKFAGVGRASLISSSLTLDGPWRRGSWMVAGRHTYIAPLAKAAGYDLPYAFYDLHGKINVDPGENDRTSLSAFRGNDRLDLKQSSVDVLLDWGNDAGSAQWTHLFSQRVFSQLLVGGSRFHSDAKIAFQDFEFQQRNRIDDLAAKGSVSFRPSPAHMVDVGFESKHLDFSWHRDIGQGSSLNFAFNGFYGALYAQDSWKASANTRIQPGLRVDYYSDGHYSGLGPRLSVRQTLTENLALRGSYGRYYQYLNLVYQEGLGFADMWFPVDSTIRPGRADHYVLGLDFGPYDAFDLSIEAYYKDFGDLVEFSSEFGRSLFDENTHLDDVFNSGSGRAFGTDVYLRNRFDGWNGWIGYSWGRARRRVEQFNRGVEYTPTYERRHQVTVMQTRTLGGRWALDLSFRYGSGQPTTLAAGRYTVTDVAGRTHDVALLGPLNEGRLPDFHRLDAGISRKYTVKGCLVEPNLQIINVYNHKNVYLRSYDLTTNPATFHDVHMLPFLPTLGVNVTF
ncbi:MAG: TonB-dependent receptor [bacterium]